MATKLNIVIDQGSDYRQAFIVSHANGVNKDLSGHTVQASLKRHYYANTGFPFEAVISNPSGGEIEILMSAANSSVIPAGRYVWDCETTLTANGHVVREREGQARITPEVT